MADIHFEIFDNADFGNKNLRFSEAPAQEQRDFLKQNGYGFTTRYGGVWYPRTKEAKDRNSDFVKEFAEKFYPESNQSQPQNQIERLAEAALENNPAEVNSPNDNRIAYLENLIAELKEERKRDQEKISRLEAALENQTEENIAELEMRQEQAELDDETEWEKENTLTEAEERAYLEKQSEIKIPAETIELTSEILDSLHEAAEKESLADEPQAEKEILHDSEKSVDNNLTVSPKELAIAKSVLPMVQYVSTLKFAQGEEREFFVNKIKEIAVAVENAPKINATDGLEEHRIVLLYFHPSGTQSFITEIGKDGDAFGFQCLNDDWENAEWGYLNLDELKNIRGMEVDFHVPAGMTVERFLYKEAPEQFPKYAKFTNKENAPAQNKKSPFDVAMETGNDIEAIAAQLKTYHTLKEEEHEEISFSKDGSLVIDEFLKPIYFNNLTDEQKEEVINGYRSADDQQMLEEDTYINSDEFISKFGDWNKANRLEKLRKADSIEKDEKIILNGNDITSTVSSLIENEDRKELQSLEKEIGRTILGTYQNDDTGIFVNVSNRNVTEISNHHYFFKEHIQSLAYIPEIIEKATFIAEVENEDKKKHPNIEKYLYFGTGLKLSGEDYTCKSVIGVDSSKNCYYDQSLSTIEKGRLVDYVMQNKKAGNLSPLMTQRETDLEGNEMPYVYYDKRLISVCQVPQLPYMEKLNEVWKPTKEAIELVKAGRLHIEKNGQEYVIIQANNETPVSELSSSELSRLSEEKKHILEQCNSIIEKYTNTHFSEQEQKVVNGYEKEDANRHQVLMSLCNIKYVHCTTKDKYGYWEINKGKEISVNEVRRLMSYDDFASGVDRASFHITAGRTANDGSFIYFNDSERKRDIQPYELSKEDIELLSKYEEAGGLKENIPKSVLEQLSKSNNDLTAQNKKDYSFEEYWKNSVSGMTMQDVKDGKVHIINIDKKERENVRSNLQSQDIAVPRTKSDLRKIREQCREILKKPDSEITEADKKILSQYEGGGGLNENNRTNSEVLNAFYTPDNLIEKVWELVDAYAPDAKTVLEPSAGVGKFANNRPDNKFTMHELNETSARINKILHPEADVIQGAFQKQFLDDGERFLKIGYEQPKHDVVIGNPPYGKYNDKYKGLGEGREFDRYEEYFIARGLEALKDEKSVLAFVVPSGFLNTVSDKQKSIIASKGEILDAYRLPEGTFSTTEVGTDILIMRKKESLDDRKNISGDLLSDGEWFKNHPEKILGEIKTRTTRFGKEEKYVTVHEGLSVQDELNKIDSFVDEIKKANQTEKLKDPLPEYSSDEENTEIISSPEIFTDEFAENITKFKKSLNNYFEKGIRPENDRFVIGKTPLVLQKTGSDVTEVTVPVSVIKKALETHGLSQDEIFSSLAKMYNPVLVFDSDKNATENKVNSKLILTDVFKDENPVALAVNTNSTIDINNRGLTVEVQDIRSIHDRNVVAKNGTDLIQKWTNDGLCRYVNDKKITDWSTVARVQFPVELLQSDNSNILTRTALVNSISSEQIPLEENKKTEPEKQNSTSPKARKEKWNISKSKGDVMTAEEFSHLYGRDFDEREFPIWKATDWQGNIDTKQVMKSWKELSALQNILTEFIDKVDGEEAGIIRPNKFTHVKPLDMSDLQKKMREIDEERMADVKKGDSAAVIVAMNNMRLSCVAPALANPAMYPGVELPPLSKLVETSPKLKFVCDAIIDMYKCNPEKGQFMYVPLGKESHGIIKDYLIAHGIPKNAVEIINGEVNNTPEKKEKITSCFNDEKNPCKIIIGGRNTAEGIDLNGNSFSMYNCSLGWNPSETIQAEGRIWRQGNLQGNVHIVYPVMNDSIDSVLYQKHDEKRSRINELWNYKGDSLNVEDINPEDLKLDLIKDPNKKAKLILQEETKEARAELSRLNLKIKSFDEIIEKRKQFELDFSDAKEIVDYQKKQIESYKESGLEVPEWIKSELKDCNKKFSKAETGLEKVNEKLSSLKITDSEKEAEYIHSLNNQKHACEEKINNIEKTLPQILKKLEIERMEQKLIEYPIEKQREILEADILNNLRPMKEVEYEIKTMRHEAMLSAKLKAGEITEIEFSLYKNAGYEKYEKWLNGDIESLEEKSVKNKATKENSSIKNENDIEKIIVYYDGHWADERGEKGKGWKYQEKSFDNPKDALDFYRTAKIPKDVGAENKNGFRFNFMNPEERLLELISEHDKTVSVQNESVSENTAVEKPAQTDLERAAEKTENAKQPEQDMDSLYADSGSLFFGFNDSDILSVHSPENEYRKSEPYDDFSITERQITEAELKRDEIIFPVLNGKESGMYKSFKDFAEHGVFDVQGKSVEFDDSGRISETGWNQLQAAMEIYRNKQFETFRYVLINRENGEIKDQLAVKSYSPNRCAVSTPDLQTIKQVITRAEELDCMVAAVHNHPSGNTVESSFDAELTESLKRNLTNGNGFCRFAGHIILDHDTFNLYTPENGWKMKLNSNAYGNSEDKLLNRNFAFLKDSVDYTWQLENVAKKINDKNNWNDNFIPVVFADSLNHVSGIKLYDKSFFDNEPQKIRNELQFSGLEANSVKAFPVITRNFSETMSVVDELLFEDKLKNLVEHSAFIDAALPESTVTEKFNILPGRQYFDVHGAKLKNPDIEATWQTRINPALFSEPEQKTMRKKEVAFER